MIKLHDRWLELDVIRGLLVILMIGYHAIFDWAYFANNIFFQKLLLFPLIQLAQILVASGFLLVVGISLQLSYLRHRSFWPIIQRSLFLGAAALIITLITRILFPANTVYFGILHLIAVGSILSLGWLKSANHQLQLSAALTVITLGILFTLSPGASFDYFPILPWLGVIWLGMVIAKVWYIPQRSHFTQLKHPFWRQPSLVFIGQQALILYLLHQPVLLMLLLLANFIANAKM